MNDLFSRNEQHPLPLQGIRIVECGVWHAGPGGAAILADMGAEVIKVESLEGDSERSQFNLGTVKFPGSDRSDWSLLFEISNRNKRGISLDIASEEGREVLKRLVESADIFLTNYKKSTIPKLGVDYDTVRKINSKIIHISVSGYGHDGPMANLGGFDPMGQAYSGITYLTGADEPVVLQIIFLDQITAIAASHAMLTALFVRERHGYGQALHVSLYGSAIWALYANFLASSLLNANLPTAWNRTITPPMRNCYKCQDGNWIMGTNHPEHKYWTTFCKLIGLESMASDIRYATPEARGENIKELIEIVDKVMLAKSQAEWLQIFQNAGLLFMPVQTMFDVLSDPQASINGYIVEVDHPIMGKIKVPGYPVQFSANSVRHDPAPGLGQHTDAVLREIGYDAEQIAHLRQKGVAK